MSNKNTPLEYQSAVEIRGAGTFPSVVLPVRS